MTVEESQAISRAYDSWEDSFNEMQSEFLLRVRAVSMANLLNEVIEEELSQREREVVLHYWFYGTRITVIAEKIGVNKATVSRTLERAKGKIFNALKYVVRYQQSVKDSRLVPIAIGEALARCSRLYFKPENIGDRIRFLRICNAISDEKLSYAINISRAQLLDIERGIFEPDIQTVASMASFFGTSIDYIITGNRGCIYE